MKDFFQAREYLHTPFGVYTIYRLNSLEKAGLTQLNRLPFSIRVILESLLRLCDEHGVARQDVVNLASWKPNRQERLSFPFRPARVVMHDYTGVSAVVDLAAMRSTMARLGGDPRKITPQVPVDLVIDHSVQVDFFATADSLTRNAELEFQRNRERYEFLRWGQQVFDNFRVVPPATGIVHQVNLEYLAQVVMTQEQAGERIAFPDTLVGADSHTTMINGLGVVGWGVGGIEAEAAMLGQPVDMLIPDVIGCKLVGQLSEGVTITDVALTITQMLRKEGVVDKFVEFYGPGLAAMSLPDRATIANMAPEYGATMGFFPVDEETLRYLGLTGRTEEQIALVEAYCKAQGLFRTADTPDPEFTDSLELDLSAVVPSLAGPKRPQDRVPLDKMKRSFQVALKAPLNDRGYQLSEEQLSKKAMVGVNGATSEITHGAVVIAAITSCTNTSNPSVMIAAGLVAKKALERGLRVKPYVKTSLAPGSRAVTEYLAEAGLLESLARLGFNVVGYGCTTCIGNSGPLSGEVVKAITSADLVTVAVLSGNRNFEGRIHPCVRANYLASPPLVVAYALAGTLAIDLVNEPLGFDQDGTPVTLQDLWPSSQEIQEVIEKAVQPQMYRQKYADIFSGNETWNGISRNGISSNGTQGSEGELFNWKAESTYIQKPPFLESFTREVPTIQGIRGARVLAVLGDSITTDHISPVGSIPADSPAGKYLVSMGVQPRDFNSYGSRRGNDRIMTRGTFANIRLKNRMAPGVEGGVTIYQDEKAPTNPPISIYDAAMRYRQDGIPLIVLAGKEYGAGSSRDWAAKGVHLLGVRAVIAESYERIHRSNLVGMGILPLQFRECDSIDTLGLTGQEVISLEGLDDHIQPQSELLARATRPDGSQVSFKVVVRLDTAMEVEYYRNGGILHTVLRKMV